MCKQASDCAARWERGLSDSCKRIAKCLLCPSTGTLPVHTKLMRSLQDLRRDQRKPSKTTPLPLYQSSLSAKMSKEEVESLPSSKPSRLCLNSLNGILWFRLHFWNITAAGYWKMQMSHMSAMKMYPFFSESAKSWKHIHLKELFFYDYYKRKICSLKKKIFKQ